MKIHVERTHIDTAIRRDSHHCMVADAIRTHYPDAKYIMVDLQTIRWSDLEHDERYFYLTPREVQQALVKFDQGITVRPFTVSLGAPIRTRKIARKWTGSPEALRKIRAKAKAKAKAKIASPAAAAATPTRHRKFGLRAFQP